MSISSSVISLVVFFALVWQIPAASSVILTPFWHQEAPLLYTSLRTIESPSDYQHAVQRFRGSFTYSSTKDLFAHPFLPDQTRIHEAPDMWLPIHLWGWDGDEVTLLFRDDNMNLAGFCNKSGTWFSFKDSEHLIPGSIPIGFRANFGLVRLFRVDFRPVFHPGQDLVKPAVSLNPGQTSVPGQD